MKQFLGLANYFRDHVENHSVITQQPLQAMVANNSKNKVLQWTEKLIATFHCVREKVATCPKLHFLDEKLPLFLHTRRVRLRYWCVSVSKDPGGQGAAYCVPQ